ncbi:unnamed protein product [Paramecium octaurelia]|uniref:GTP-binding protein n=1 Tax=Paramecium octaurelia TaxID=43137 RepID=A0A8S1TB93_PAROT|nr:unnamed protein product [Paramecium octaurelia]
MEAEIKFKFVLLGSSPVGKSSLLYRFHDNRFKEDLNPTIGVEFLMKSLELNKKAIQLQIWDPTGQQQFMTLIKSYLAGAHGCLIVYDVTNKQSFKEISIWLEQTKTYTNADIPIILVGTKSDLDGARKVTTKEGQKMAKTLGTLFIETSAKDGSNVQQVFLNLVEEALTRHEKQKKQEETKNQ